jgi:hypothetical protein
MVIKTKALLAGAVLLTLVVMTGSAGLACGAKPGTSPTSPTIAPPETPAIPPVSTESELPVGYNTYTDESQLFSISYPADWKMPMSQVPGLEQKARQAINDLKTGVAIEDTSVIFIAGLQTSSGYEPNMNIGVGPAPIGSNTHDQIVESVLGGFKTLSSDFKEVDRIKTTVDGREATVVSWEGSVSGQKSLHFVQMFTVVDKTVWIVTCTVTPEKFSQWENDFNTIVRSLHISN